MIESGIVSRTGVRVNVHAGFDGRSPLACRAVSRAFASVLVCRASRE